MKKLFKPASLAFIILMPVVFFVIGIYLAGVFNAGKGQGLAVGAIVFGWGVISGGLAFLLSFFIVKVVTHKRIVRLNVVLLFVAIVLFGISYLRFRQKQKEDKASRKKFEIHPGKVTKPGAEETTVLWAVQATFPHQYQLTHQAILIEPGNAEPEMGIGFFSPLLTERGLLYFYGLVNFDKPVDDHTPHDSIAFRKTRYGYFEISYAPPYFYPEYLKLDYDILLLKVLSAGRDFLEVVVNRETGQTAYVSRFDGIFKYWPEFLLGVHSVEFKNPTAQTVKFKPLEHASDVHSNFMFMYPKMLKNEWMKVDLLDQDLKKVNEGWIKWKENNTLLIRYSLLS